LVLCDQSILGKNVLMRTYHLLMHHLMFAAGAVCLVHCTAYGNAPANEQGDGSKEQPEPMEAPA